MNMNNKALCLEILTIPGFFETLNTEISSYIFLIYIHSSSACNYTVLNKEYNNDQNKASYFSLNKE